MLKSINLGEKIIKIPKQLMKLQWEPENSEIGKRLFDSSCNLKGTVKEKWKGVLTETWES